MKEDMNKVKSRRDFLNDGMRAILLTGFAFTGLSLGMRNLTDSENGSSCPIDLPCRNCTKFRGCQKPEAQSVKTDNEASGYLTEPMENGGRSVG